MKMYGNGDKDKKKKKKKDQETSGTAPGKNTKLQDMRDTSGSSTSNVKVGSKKYSTYKGVKTEWTWNGSGWEGRPVKKPDYNPPPTQSSGPKKRKAKSVPAMKKKPSRGMSFFGS